MLKGKQCPICEIFVLNIRTHLDKHDIDEKLKESLVFHAYKRSYALLKKKCVYPSCKSLKFTSNTELEKHIKSLHDTEIQEPNTS